MHDNSALRAFRWDENRAGVTKKPKGIRNIDGGSIGGPIKKNKLFFFARLGRHVRARRPLRRSSPSRRTTSAPGISAECWGRQILDASGNAIMVPTTEGGSVPLREGMVFDPFTGNLDGTGRSVFSSGGRLNVIPACAAERPHDEAAGPGPAPNLPGDTNNYFNSGTQRLNRNNFDAKVNWNRNEKHQLWVKYSVMNALVHGDFGLGEAGGACLCDGGAR